MHLSWAEIWIDHNLKLIGLSILMFQLYVLKKLVPIYVLLILVGIAVEFSEKRLIEEKMVFKFTASDHEMQISFLCVLIPWLSFCLPMQ